MQDRVEGCLGGLISQEKDRVAAGGSVARFPQQPQGAARHPLAARMAHVPSLQTNSLQ